MSEWLKEHAWKACVGETLPWVRIPLSPPAFAHRHANPPTSHCDKGGPQMVRSRRLRFDRPLPDQLTLRAQPVADGIAGSAAAFQIELIRANADLLVA